MTYEESDVLWREIAKNSDLREENWKLLDRIADLQAEVSALSTERRQDKLGQRVRR